MKRCFRCDNDRPADKVMPIDTEMPFVPKNVKQPNAPVVGRINCFICDICICEIVTEWVIKKHEINLVKMS